MQKLRENSYLLFFYYINSYIILLFDVKETYTHAEYVAHLFYA